MHASTTKCVSNTGTFRYLTPRGQDEHPSMRPDVIRNVGWGGPHPMGSGGRPPRESSPIGSARSSQRASSRGSKLTAAGAVVTQPSPRYLQRPPWWGAGGMPRPHNSDYGRFYYK